MNKLFFVTLAAFVACAMANPVPYNETDVVINDLESQVALFETDDIEVGSLTADKKILFSDFCLSSRDNVKSTLQSTVNEAVSKVFKVLFDTITEVNEELMSVQKEVVKEGAKLIEQSGIEQDPKLSKAPLDVDQLDDNVEQNLEKVDKYVTSNGLLSTIKESVALVFKTVVDTIARETTTRLALLKAKFNGENARDQIEEACERISKNVRPELESQLSSYKAQLTSESGENEATKSIISSTDLKNIGCVTTDRINKVVQFCNYLKVVGPILYPLVGL